MKALILPMAAALALALASHADTVKVGEQVYEDVLVEESEGQYHILLPDTGETVTVSSKRTDVEITYRSEPAEREQLRASWKSRADAREDSPSADAESAPMVLTTQTLEQETGIRETAAFETELLLWAQLPDAYRERLYNATAEAAQSEVRFNRQRVQELQRARDANQAQVQAEIAQAQQVQAEAAQEIAARENEAANAADAAAAVAARNRAGFVYLNDNDLDGPGVVALGNGDVAIGDTIGLTPSRYRLGTYYWNEYAVLAEAAAQEAAAITQSAAAETAAAVARVDALQQEDAARARQQGALEENAQAAVERAQADLTKMDALENALTSNYALKLEFEPVAELEVTDADGEASAPVRVSAPVWRVLWGVSGPTEGSRTLLISVMDEDGQLVTGVTDAAANHRRYLLLDGPGNYTMKVNGADGSNFYVVAEEVTEAEEDVPGSEKLETEE